MAQISKTLYRDIAAHYAQIWEYLNGVAGQAENAVYAVVDVTTTNYYPTNATGGVGAASDSAALEIELALLDVLNAAYTSVQGISSSSSSLLDAVRAMNNHVINNYPTSTDAPTGYDGARATTPDAKLADFVNGVAYKNYSCVPSGWAQLSQDAGYDTDGTLGIGPWKWDTCVS
jgi:hypothetical protein